MRVFRAMSVGVVPVMVVLFGVAGSADAGEPAEAIGSAPVAEPEPAVVAVAGPEPPPVTSAGPKRKPCGKGGAGCGKRRPRQGSRELRAAVALREEVLEVARSMAEAGRPGVAALLGSAADAHADPVLHLAAVEAELRDPKLSRERLRLAQDRTAAARRLLEQPGAPKVAAAEGPALLEQCDALAAYSERRLEGLRLMRRGRGLWIGGTVLLATSVGGFVALGSGAALGGRVDTARASYSGADAAYLGALSSAREQATLRMGVGAVVGLVGAAAGIPLSISGARDRRTARAVSTERPTVRVTPGFATLSFTGQF